MLDLGRNGIMSHFVILIGGPGLFEGCDKAHDQTWLNYVVPMQLAAQKNLYKKTTGETVHWVVYEPPYRNRWNDDSVITAAEKKESDGYNLHSIRKAAADKILAKGAANYLDRIKSIANSYSIRYKGINTPKDFWNYLKALPDNSINRIWYSGHASDKELMLSLTHAGACVASAYVKDTIKNTDISKYASIKKKFRTTTTSISKFYGCYTNDFAKEWHKTFGVGAAGAKEKIDFGVINRPSNIVNIMERIEKTATTVGPPDWTVHK